MGLIISKIAAYVEKTNSMSMDHPPISYLSASDFTPAGIPREGAEEKLELAMKSIITADLSTRKLLFPVLKSRLNNLKASSKFTQCDIEALLKKYPEIDDLKLFALHDLFQVFEVNGDGLIDIAEMCVGLDNCGDTSDTKERVEVLGRADDDHTGSIDFEEFCQIIYELEITGSSKHRLATTFKTIDDNIRFIRHMSTAQQIQSGSF